MHMFRRSWLAVLLAAPTSLAGTIVTILDHDIYMSGPPAIMTGSDGLGLIVYEDESVDDLKVAHCSNAECTSATISTIHVPGRAYSPRVTRGADGLPLISYSTGNPNFNLRVAVCADLACTSAAVSMPVAHVWNDSPLEIGQDGGLRMAYTDYVTPETVTFMACPVTWCTRQTIGEGFGPALAVRPDGLALIAYQTGDLGPSIVGPLKLQSCTNLSCTSAHHRVVHERGFAPAFALRSGSYPLMAYGADSQLKLDFCLDSGCALPPVSKVLSNEDVVDPSLAIGSDGFPVVSYRRFSTNETRVVHCSDAACSAVTRRTIANPDLRPGWSPLTIGGDGLPLLAIVQVNDATNSSHLRVAHCSNPACSNTN